MWRAGCPSSRAALADRLGAVAACLLLGSALATPARAAGPPLTPTQVAQGRAIFQRECKMCHGGKGDGQGTGAHLLTPRPRDFTGGVFKFRSTPNGELPADDDLFRTITMGLPGSMMPSFKELPERERWALVAVVKEFAKIKKAPRAVSVPPEPPGSPALLEKGQKVYADLKCANCHGATGRGDGPSALTLKSEAGVRMWATDLTQGPFRGGSEARDLYLRIATGVDGTPMPAYATSASPGEIWALVHYLRSLIQKPADQAAK
jgi:mono/diheme cytochrome c family protein